MSKTEDAIEQPRRIVGGNPSERYTLEYIAAAERIPTYIYQFQLLSDDDFNEVVNDIGWRAALLVLRSKALTENKDQVRALDLYLRICNEDRDRRKERGKPAERNVHTAGFKQDPRNKDQSKTTDVEASTIDVVDPTSK